jgi:hypothetical protein
MWRLVSDLDGLRDEINEVGRRAQRRIDPGARGLVIAAGVFVLLGSAFLPWARGFAGWQIVLGQAPGVGILPRIFGTLVLVAGVLGSILTLSLARWILAWLCAYGCGVSTVFGLLSIWSQQTTASHAPGPGPGAGLVIAAITALILAVHWVQVAGTRT